MTPIGWQNVVSLKMSSTTTTTSVPLPDEGKPAEAPSIKLGCEYVSRLMWWRVGILDPLFCSRRWGIEIHHQRHYHSRFVSVSSRWPLHYACRTGNLEHVRCLVDYYRYPVNEADAHDATPLYLAALTGHTEICQFLLERGATCDNSDAARIFYVALTPTLRRMLREWSLTAASRDPYLESLLQNFHSASVDDASADCAACLWLADPAQPAVNRERIIPLHSIMIRSRCPWLARHLVETSPGDDLGVSFVLALPENVHDDGDVVYLVLKYLYTGRLELRDFDKALIALNISAAWELTSLSASLEQLIDRHVLESPKKASKSRLFRCEIGDIVGLQRDMRKLAELVSTPLTEIPDRVAGSDVTLQCQDRTWSVHRFRLTTQSDYFACALQGNFREAATSTVDLSHLVESPSAVQLLIEWMYADCFLKPTVTTLELGTQVLQLGVALLINPRLSVYVANTVLWPAVSVETVFFILDLARSHGSLDRLEERCCHVIAKSVLGNSDVEMVSLLRALLTAEASEIVQGGDVQVADVPLAADIRRAIVRLEEEHDLKTEKMAQLQELVQQAVFGLDPS
jgi:Ankyrin repeats (3 copies)/BTB/POZ domain